MENAFFIFTDFVVSECGHYTGYEVDSIALNEEDAKKRVGELRKIGWSFADYRVCPLVENEMKEEEK